MHSHNQRGEFSNAATLATLLNRTLLVPHIRLGKPQPWKSKPFLEAAQVSEQKSNWIEQCRPYLPTLEDKNAKLDGPKECRNYHRYTEIDWPLMVNLDTMPSGASFLPRDDMSPHWFTAPVAEGGLGLSQEDIHDFDDPFRYTWQIYDDEKAPKLQDNYERRLDLSQLREPPYSDKRLLYFGSLFGGSRLQFRSPEANATAMKAYNALTFRNPLVDSIAIDITHKLGGRENYVGVHLRVGDGSFMVGVLLLMLQVLN